MMKNITFCLFVLIVLWCPLFADLESEENTNERTFIEELKIMLMLPYERASDYKANEIELPDLNNLTKVGYCVVVSDVSEVTRVGDFVVVSDVSEVTGGGSFDVVSNGESNSDVIRPTPAGHKWFTFDVCTADLSVIQVSITKPNSFSVASDLIVTPILTRGYSDPAAIPKVNIPRLEEGEYSLITKTGRFTRVTRLSVERGLLIQIDYFPRMQLLKSPVNEGVLIAQMNTLIESLVTLFDGDNNIHNETNDTDLIINNIKNRYSEARIRGNSHLSSHAGAVKIDLFLSEVPPVDQTDTENSIEMEVAEKVIAGKPYIIARHDGKALPLVKLADPNEVMSMLDATSFQNKEYDDIADIQIQVIYQDKPVNIEQILRNDGSYQVQFYSAGSRTLRVLLFNRRGVVVMSGEIEVDVTPSSE